MVGGGSWGDLAHNLLYTVPGNIVGGGLLVGLAYSWVGKQAVPRSGSRTGRSAEALIDLDDGDHDPAMAATGNGNVHPA